MLIVLTLYVYMCICLYFCLFLLWQWLLIAVAPCLLRVRSLSVCLFVYSLDFIYKKKRKFFRLLRCNSYAECAIVTVFCAHQRREMGDRECIVHARHFHMHGVGGRFGSMMGKKGAQDICCLGNWSAPACPGGL